MTDATNWRMEGDHLLLSGELTYSTLGPIWYQKASLLSQVSVIDVAGLTHVDSAGLALIVQFIGDAEKQGRVVKISGVTERLNTLITLYNLKGLLGDNLLSW